MTVRKETVVTGDENIPEHSGGDILRRQARTRVAEPAPVTGNSTKPHKSDDLGPKPLSEEECLAATRAWLAAEEIRRRR